MNDKEHKRRMAYEALIILLMLGLLCFICRIWPILLLIILGIFAAAIRLLFLSSKRTEKPEPVTLPLLPEKNPEPTEKDVQALAYSVILRRITEFVSEKYPNARWVFESPNAEKLIESGGDVFIILNRAGGYARARVDIVNLQVTGLTFQSAADEKKTGDEKNPDAAIENQDAGKSDTAAAEEPVLPPENYELLAFEWVESHLMDINKRCNEAIGAGKNEIIIPADELPVKESWKDICRELIRSDLNDAQCAAEGIKIKFRQSNAERK